MSGMATCSGCGTEFSEQARLCPKCGRMARRGSGVRLLAYVVVGIVAAGVGVFAVVHLL